jgi:hypothetical protein
MYIKESEDSHTGLTFQKLVLFLFRGLYYVHFFD